MSTTSHKMLGRDRVTVDCCKADDIGSTPGQKTRYRHMARARNKAQWRREAQKD